MKDLSLGQDDLCRHRSILGMLRELHLPQMASYLENCCLDPASDYLSHAGFLSDMLSAECRRRRVHREKNLRRMADLPQPNASLDDTDLILNAPGTLPVLRDCSWILRHDNMAVAGASGSGKTFFACAVANEAIARGFEVRLIRCPVLLRRLAEDPADAASLRKADLLILDDLSMIDPNMCDLEEMFQFVDTACGSTSVMTLASASTSSWPAFFGSPFYGEAIVRRLLKDAIRIDLQKPPAPDEDPIDWPPLEFEQELDFSNTLLPF